VLQSNRAADDGRCPATQDPNCQNRPMPSLSTRTRRAVTLAVALVASVAISACRDDSKTGDAARFCQQVQDNLEALRANPQTPDEVDGLIELWEDVGEDAPLSIEPDWQAHILNFETALEGEDMDEVYARIYATERSSVAVATWVSDNCGIDWGPVSTIVPQITTTVAPPTTAAG
jgi:hypothetical protein